MTLTSRVPAIRVRPALAVVAGLALALALLPLAGTAQAQDPPPNEPCPEGTPESDFIDRETARSAHLLGIDCVAFHAISVGNSDDDGNSIYVPSGIVNRAQMATFIANTLEAAGFELPPGDGADEFDDIDETVHRRRINAIARAGIVSGRTEDTYAPNLLVSRAQMATFIVQAAEWAFDDDFEADGGPYFADAIGTTHEANIDAGFELGLFTGRVAPTEDAPGVYDTRSGTRRDQMATFLSRLLDFLWEEAPQGIGGTVSDDDADNGGPIEGATVTAFDNGTEVDSTTTDADGEYFLDLDVGTYDLTAEADGYEDGAAADVAVTEDTVTEQDFALTAIVPQGIAGTVTDDDVANGGPIEGATVSAFDNGTEVDSTTTDADGEYFLDLDVGTYDVTATAEGYEDATEPDVPVTEDTVTEQDFALTAIVPQGIAGTVTDDDVANGGPIEGATVSAFDNGTEVDSATTGADGEYFLDLDVGTYDVTATAEGYEDATEPDVPVTEDTVTEQDFALTPEPVPTAALTPDREVAPVSQEADPSNDAPSPGDVNFVLAAFDAEGTEVDTTRNYTFTVENTGTADVVACVRCGTAPPVTIAPGETEAFEDEPERERVRVDAAAATSVEVTGETTVDGETVTDTTTATWVEVDEAPTGGGAAATFTGAVGDFDTENEWYLLVTDDETPLSVVVEYTGGATNTYLVNGAPAADLDEFEAALEVGATVDYATNADDEQTHDVTPLVP